MNGFIYFIRCGEFVKIGFSKVPDVRFRALETASPHPITLAAKHPGTEKDEAALHLLLSEHHHRREWFRSCPQIEGIITNGIPRFMHPIAFEAVGPVPKDAIRMARAALGESQIEFARRIGVTQPTLCRWEQSGLPRRGLSQLAMVRVLHEIATTQPARAAS